VELHLRHLPCEMASPTAKLSCMRTLKCSMLTWRQAAVQRVHAGVLCCCHNTTYQYVFVFVMTRGALLRWVDQTLASRRMLWGRARHKR
jgi:hypothetical protein